jgi:hypothetical protein
MIRTLPDNAQKAFRRDARGMFVFLVDDRNHHRRQSRHRPRFHASSIIQTSVPLLLLGVYFLQTKADPWRPSDLVRVHVWICLRSFLLRGRDYLRRPASHFAPCCVWQDRAPQNRAQLISEGWQMRDGPVLRDRPFVCSCGLSRAECRPLIRPHSTSNFTNEFV